MSNFQVGDIVQCVNDKHDPALITHGQLVLGWHYTIRDTGIGHTQGVAVPSVRVHEITQRSSMMGTEYWFEARYFRKVGVAHDERELLAKQPQRIS